ncbi:MAG: hypothetical protein R3B48_16305 [Kofleriaceae bacterium]
MMMVSPASASDVGGVVGVAGDVGDVDDVDDVDDVGAVFGGLDVVPPAAGVLDAVPPGGLDVVPPAAGVLDAVPPGGLDVVPPTAGALEAAPLAAGAAATGTPACASAPSTSRQLTPNVVAAPRRAVALAQVFQLGLRTCIQVTPRDRG